MASSNPADTPVGSGSPTHATYEIDVPVRPAAASSDPDAQRPHSSQSSHSSRSSQSQSSETSQQSQSQSQPQPKSQPQQIRIPKITPLSTGPPPAELAKGLEGRYVDEFGNILDWDGTVLGRVDGDLPSMVGRPVAANGEIQDVDGSVVGHVCENYSAPALKPLGGGLQVDADGNIYDSQGAVVGKLNAPMPAEHDDSIGKDKGKDKDMDASKPAQSQNQNQSQSHNHSQNQTRPPPPNTGPKQPSAPRPDEIYLDVKSTFEGIQLIIKIPTVFTRDTRAPDSNDNR
ncbi:hypothetical protein AK830_g3087 [Neonectria ditissima]|uniref:Uncharacterized protein n=1 Tax=Neonectria ditissima TaxID=78410 RepID=A0A0P7B9J9_9HYPO|nr:hypothetical protein AK830_g3087 [Neonectria ditissima]